LSFFSEKNDYDVRLSAITYRPIIAHSERHGSDPPEEFVVIDAIGTATEEG
jgi:hypothetical protein